MWFWRSRDEEESPEAQALKRGVTHIQETRLELSAALDDLRAVVTQRALEGKVKPNDR